MIQEKFDSENVEAGYYYDATKYDPTLIKPSRAGRLNENPYISEKDKIEILNICKIGVRLLL